MHTQEDVKLLDRPVKYFDLMEKVGTRGRYQWIIFGVFLLQWFVTGVVLLGPAFFFMSPQPNCPSNISKKDCWEWVCDQPEETWEQYLVKQKSLVYSFGQMYICDKQIYITITTSLTYIGCFFGYVFFSFFSDNFGRAKTLFMTWLLACVGLVLMVAAQNIYMVGAGLFLVGAGTDSAINIAFFILAEQFEDQMRQYCSIAIQIAFNLGGMAIAGMYALMRNWFTLTTYGMLIPALVALFAMYFLVETPKFLIKKGMDEALKGFQKIAKMNGLKSNPVTEQDIRSVMDEQATDAQEDQLFVTPYHLFSFKSLRLKSICCCMVSFTIYMLYYGPIHIIDQIGLDIYVNQVLLGLSELITYIITFFLITKIPRRLSGLIAFTVCLVTSVGCLFLAKKPEDCDFCTQQIIELILVCINRFALSMYFSIFLIFTYEMYPAQARGLGNGISSAFGTVASSTITYMIAGLEHNKISPMWLFSVTAIVGLVFLFPMKETKGLPLLDDIEEVFYKKSVHKSIKQNSLVKTVTSAKHGGSMHGN